MIERGAKYLLLLSRSGASSRIAKEFVAEFDHDDDDVRIETPSCDVSDEQALASTLKKYATTMPPVQGCIQASMILSVRLLTYPSISYQTVPNTHTHTHTHTESAIDSITE